MPLSHFSFFFFNDTATTEIYTLSLHDALPIWSNALAGHPDPLFQFNHQPFDYYANYANGTPGQAAHLKDETDLVQAIRTDTLPAVSFYKPIGTDNEHPGYANLLDGEMHAASLIQSIMASKAWKSTAIVVAYDENGGVWGPRRPPAGRRGGARRPPPAPGPAPARPPRPPPPPP